MRAVVHCGLPKTGTTTLQVSLWQARRELRRHGVCYPDGRVRPLHTHKAITPLFMDGSRISPHVLYDGYRRRSDDEVRGEAQRVWTGIVREVRRARPELVVLSAETYASLRTVEEAERLRDLLADIADDVRISLYVRNPAERYLSSVRQRAKARGEFFAPAGASLRPFLESVEQAFGAPAFVRVYDRAHLVDGDIVADFLATSLDGHVPPSAVPVVRRNDSLSTEAAALLLAYRRQAAPEAAGLNTIEPRVLKRAVTIVDAGLPRPMPEALRRDVHAAVLRASGDLDWVKDRYGLVLPGVTYPVDDGSPLPDLTAYDRVEDVCEFDADRYSVLVSRTLALLVEAGLAHGAFGSLGVPSRLASLVPRRARTWARRWRSAAES